MERFWPYIGSFTFSTMAVIGIRYTIILVTAILFSKLNAQTVGSTNYTIPEEVNIGEGISLCNSALCSHGDTVTHSQLCKCDDVCPLYGDCCYGYEDTTSSSLEEKISIPMTCFGTELVNVPNFMYPSLWKTTGGYFVVDRCPKDYTNEDILEDCQVAEYDWVSHPPLSSWSEYSRHLPVVDTRHNISYKNVYCAWCSNVPIATMELWTLKTECLLDFPPRHCHSVYITAPELSRGCIVIDVKSCSSTADETISDMCHSGYFLPTIQNGTVYQNPHCVLCNEPNISTGLNYTRTFCPFDPPGPMTRAMNIPQFLPFDFYSKASRDFNATTVLCANGFTLNVSSNGCNPTGQETRVSFSEICPFHFGSVHIFFYFFANTSKQFDEIALETALYFGLNESSISQIQCNTTSDNVICLQLDIIATSIEIEFFFNNSDALFKSIRSKLDVQKLFLLHSCPGYNVNTVCQDGSTLPLNSGDSDLFRFADILVITLREQNRIYYNITFASSVTLSIADDRKELERTLHFCPQPSGRVELLCPYFIMDTDEYILKISNDKEYIFSEYLTNPLSKKYFLVAENNQAHVCSLPGKDLGYLVVIYIVLSAWSLLFLLLAFLTYCMFSFLRNGPGYLTMNFFVALFFSQFILLIGTNQTRNPVVCNILAIAGHYTWLAAFLWTSIIALNVSHTFGTAMVSLRAKYSRKKLCVIMTTGWGIPVIFVGICIFLRSPVVSFVKFNYGSVDGCWIKPGRVNLIIFGLPVLACLLFNLVMFVWAIRGIRMSMKASRKVQRNKTSTELLKEEIILYIKVSIIMGFCWTWAFLAGFFPDVFAFLILNTVISPLQGFLVFCIYVCNKRMISKWRTKMSEVMLSEENTQRMSLPLSQDVTKSKVEYEEG